MSVSRKASINLQSLLMDVLNYRKFSLVKIISFVFWIKFGNWHLYLFEDSETTFARNTKVYKKISQFYKPIVSVFLKEVLQFY